MGTEQRTKGAELEPSCVALPPFIKGFSCQVVIPVFNREPSDIHGPVWNAGQTEVDTCCDLILKVTPARNDITAPGSRTVALLSSVGRSRENENPLLRAGFT